MDQYIKNTFQGYAFGEDYHQVFLNKPVTTLMNEEIIRMRHNNVITDKDLEMVKFICEFRFATAEIVDVYLNAGDSIEDIRARLDKLVKHRILNKFMLSIYKEDSFKEDALHIYCMDIGGKTLLSQFSSIDITNWNTSKTMWSADHIGNDLVTANFYVRILQTCPKKLEYFKSNPEYRISKIAVVPSFEFCIKLGNTRKYCVGQIVRDYDVPIKWRDRSTQLESILCTKAWMKYFCDGGATPPVLFVVAENDDVAYEASKIITTVSAIEAFRLTTDERMKLPLSNSGAFLKYDKENDKLQQVKASMFDPD